MGSSIRPFPAVRRARKLAETHRCSQGIISVYADELEPDDLMMAAMDAGADDVKLPEKTEDNEEEEGSR